jgi:hypothetical protein
MDDTWTNSSKLMVVGFELGFVAVVGLVILKHPSPASVINSNAGLRNHLYFNILIFVIIVMPAKFALSAPMCQLVIAWPVYR